MNNNKTEELKERLEELHRTQQARLDVGADDLDIREEIAEVEDEIKELEDDINEENNNGNDTNVGSIENSIEEDITELREMIDSDIEAAGGLENFNQYCCSVEAITSWIDRVLDIVERINKK